MTYKFLQKLIFVTFLSATVFSSCRKEQPVDTDRSATVNLSTPIIYFDTVFTSVGSTTKRFKIYNHNSKAIVISSISLLHGSGSLFRMNVDGTAGRSISNVQIGPKDSLFVFVEVTINPSAGATPFVVSDSIMVSCNGNNSAVGLVAWGQNAYYIRGTIPLSNLVYTIVARGGHDTTWTKDKPIVVYGYAVVDSASKLTIQAGAHIYFHTGGGLWVYRYGNLAVNGTQKDTVVFEGDRLDYDYRGVSGQWDRIWINEGSTDNTINYAVIKNGGIGLQTEVLGTVQTGNKLVLTNTIIKNMSSTGILSKSYNVIGYNDVVANCGQSCLALLQGGTYDFRQCTFADYYFYSNRQTPAVILSNYYQASTSSPIIASDLSASFENSIIYGSLQNEIGFASVGSASVKFNYTFNHCLMAIDPTVNLQTANYISPFTNSNGTQIFTSQNTFTLVTGSPAIGVGDASLNSGIQALSADINGNPRPTGNPNPDLGAYQH